MTKEADIAVIGMAVMGRNLALNMAEKGFTVAIYNRTVERVDEVIAEAGPLAERLIPCRSLEHLRDLVKAPRPILMMVKAGPAVDETIEILAPHLDGGDILIDAGNANFRDTVRREKHVRGLGLQFLGIGVSGGEEGARHGPSIMSGGAREAYDRIEPVLTAISARFEGTPCSAYMGPDGAGHFVKTIHNGIEYADMQMIAETYGIMRDGLGMSAREIGAVFDGWNGGRLNSYLIEITGKVLAADDPETGMPIVDLILDKAGQKGTGRWSAIEAQQLGVPATAIEAAVAARGLSALKEERTAAAAVYGPPAVSQASTPQGDIVGELELALLAGKIAAYAQGFAVMQAASDEYGWNLPMATVARIWRAGCIIRSQFLGSIAAAFAPGEQITNLMMAPAFVEMMSQAQAALRITVGRAALQGLPVPSLSAALAYFDSYRQARGTANLVQAQRDFFGAHGFERTDRSGPQHGPWASA